MTKRVGILISGGGSNMVELVRSMQGDHPARPVFVLANDPGAGGLEKARAMDLPALAVDHRPFKGDRAAFEAALSAAIAPHAPDILCLAGFMRVLTADFVEAWRGRMLNIHPSLLPKYRGLDTHARAIAAGDAEAGCTVHEVTPALDDGPVLGQARVPILPGDTARSLAERVLLAEHVLYPAVLRRFAAGDTRPVMLPEPG
ncbi:phosphoribosylglycinamide formyltransferase [Roseibacterium sp. SDUM158017]|uniref:phosphoribosylglycinamide formyltransferase n=1 Tax=Roseicyclus salinarum TaxID=3036773 RepID=UPI002415531F|nr:phosphoribosylglycinamide formyltransferase [Roseibacterium sp. SDUM158017]MDG4647546.1 phosphoribosylglycinamide formyltransferase [Roseibacterium sp. SDUM158017]